MWDWSGITNQGVSMTRKPAHNIKIGNGLAHAKKNLLKGDVIDCMYSGGCLEGDVINEM